MCSHTSCTSPSVLLPAGEKACMALIKEFKECGGPIHKVENGVNICKRLEGFY